MNVAQSPAPSANYTASLEVDVVRGSVPSVRFGTLWPFFAAAAVVFATGCTPTEFRGARAVNELPEGERAFGLRVESCRDSAGGEVQRRGRFELVRQRNRTVVVERRALHSPLVYEDSTQGDDGVRVFRAWVASPEGALVQEVSVGTDAKGTLVVSEARSGLGGAASGEPIVRCELGREFAVLDESDDSLKDKPRIVRQIRPHDDGQPTVR